MKRMSLLLVSALAVVFVMQAADDLWIDVNFTRDSTMWKEAMPPLVVNQFSLQVVPDPTVDYFGHSFTANTTFGKFAVSNFSYTPLNAENLSQQLIYAIRMQNNAASQWILPGTTDVGKIKINFMNGNAANDAELFLQRYVGGEGDDAVWEDFSPAVKFNIPPHAQSTTSFVEEKVLNLTDSPKLRLVGPSLRNVHIFALSLSKNTNSGLPNNLIDKFDVRVNKRMLNLKSELTNYSASIFSTAGVLIGELQKDNSFIFASTGIYLIRIQTPEGTFTKKVAVF